MINEKGTYKTAHFEKKRYLNEQSLKSCILKCKQCCFYVVDLLTLRMNVPFKKESWWLNWAEICKQSSRLFIESTNVLKPAWSVRSVQLYYLHLYQPIKEWLHSDHLGQCYLDLDSNWSPHLHRSEPIREEEGEGRHSLAKSVSLLPQEECAVSIQI